jgi:hypothetical protein
MRCQPKLGTLLVPTVYRYAYPCTTSWTFAALFSEYVYQGRELLIRLRSPEEGPTATPVDLHILRVQLFLLDHEAANMEQRKMLSTALEVANVLSDKKPSTPF